MQVKVIRHKLIHDKLGTLNKGRVVDLPENQAADFLKRGFVERYETKVIDTRPQQPAGMDVQPSASPVGQASPQTTLSESESGKPKRGRPRKDQS